LENGHCGLEEKEVFGKQAKGFCVFPLTQGATFTSTVTSFFGHTPANGFGHNLLGHCFQWFDVHMQQFV